MEVISKKAWQKIADDLERKSELREINKEQKTFTGFLLECAEISKDYGDICIEGGRLEFFNGVPSIDGCNITYIPKGDIMKETEALELLEEMRINCLVATNYKDPKRYDKIDALTLAINLIREMAIKEPVDDKD